MGRGRQRMGIVGGGVMVAPLGTMPSGGDGVGGSRGAPPRCAPRSRCVLGPPRVVSPAWVTSEGSTAATSGFSTARRWPGTAGGTLGSGTAGGGPCPSHGLSSQTDRRCLGWLSVPNPAGGDISWKSLWPVASGSGSGWPALRGRAARGQPMAPPRLAHPRDVSPAGSGDTGTPWGCHGGVGTKSCPHIPLFVPSCFPRPGRGQQWWQ